MVSVVAEAAVAAEAVAVAVVGHLVGVTDGGGAVVAVAAVVAATVACKR